VAQRITYCGSEALLAGNPDVLCEGFAVKNTISPDRLARTSRRRGGRGGGKALLDEAYAAALSRDTPLVVAEYQTAEPVKVAANAVLATKISFINARAEIAEIADADVAKLADAIGKTPGLAGSC
jgi:UDPglucose 6-dehydrogenase